MIWWRWRRNGHEAAALRRAAEQELQQVRAQAGHVDRTAEHLAQNPDEWMRRVAAAFRPPEP